MLTCFSLFRFLAVFVCAISFGCSQPAVPVPQEAHTESPPPVAKETPYSEIRRRPIPNSELTLLGNWSTMKGGIIEIWPNKLIHHHIDGQDRYKYSAEKIEGAEESYLLTIAISSKERSWLQKFLYVKKIGPDNIIDAVEVWMAPYADIKDFEKDFRAQKLGFGDFFYGNPGKY